MVSLVSVKKGNNSYKIISNRMGPGDDYVFAEWLTDDIHFLVELFLTNS